ncbi:acetoacetate metabolism regulatory protein AtoC [Sulfuricaulis limicola]|uniref:Acetoacetate metabolism regulatory protein AtoC n=1 Tax=Sulfuricaulis limicola TaxID=1620215 RepID=A0A1B4XGV6_9GAMM|nr:sigma-54 dependent transcriptional regulator [Sulfuricaulis limicola]BAV34052.1 acetoacetate metabolism regulatory protein AtoC [Sulfuricaulis limicola]
MNRNTILVVDDQSAHRDLCRSALNDAGFAVVTASSGAEALERLRGASFGLVLTDQIMPGMSGLELLRDIHRERPRLPVIIVTAHGTVETAVDAMKAGASDFIPKPFTPEELLLVVRRVLEHQDLVEEVRALRERVGDPYRFDRIVSKSPKMSEIFEMVRNLADLDTTVLITGETGTGKELVAHAIHYNSYRRDQRFVRINCGALTETLLESELFGHERGAFSGAVQARRGKFEYASGGTLLLDEIGDISQAMQLKLLRVLQEKEIQRVGGNETIAVDVRILATTNKNLEQAMAAGAFRSDLYYRLNVARIQLPPLRERMEDVPLLAEHFLRVFCEKTGRTLRGIGREAMNAMMDYDWPGNVRELANAIERAAVMAKEDHIAGIELPLRPERQRPEESDACLIDLPFKDGRQRALAHYEKTYLVQCLRRYHGNIGQSAQHCGIDAKTFYRKMQEYGLDKRDFKNIEEPVESG